VQGHAGDGDLTLGVAGARLGLGLAVGGAPAGLDAGALLGIARENVTGAQRLADAGEAGHLLGDVDVAACGGTVGQLVEDVGLAPGPVADDPGHDTVAEGADRVSRGEADVDAHVGAPDVGLLSAEGILIRGGGPGARGAGEEHGGERGGGQEGARGAP
jgi:hypothetical protein